MGDLIAISSIGLALAAIGFSVRAGRAVAVAEAALRQAQGEREAAVDAARAAAREETERAGERVRALQREVEVLSAIREVALIANDDVSFERILGEVLKVVEQVVEASEIAIHVVDEGG